MRPASLRRLFLVVLCACALPAAGLAACGGEDEEGAGGGETSTSAPARGGEDGAGAGSGGSGGGGNSGDSSDAGGEVDLSVRPQSVRGARVTSTGAVQTLPPSEPSHEVAQENTYGSVRSFGSEAEGSEATNITFALVQYLDARARGDWATACARLYSPLREPLEDPEEGRGCAETYGRLMSRLPAAARAEQAKVDVSSVRRGEGNRAFVVYKTPKTLSADMPMYVEDGVWKVGAVEAYVLRPGETG